MWNFRAYNFTPTQNALTPSELRSCVKVEVDVLAWAPVPNKPTVSVNVKQH